MNRAAIEITAELTAHKTMFQFMLSSLRVALAASGDTPARQQAIQAIREELRLHRGEMLTLGPQPELFPEEVREANAAFRAQLGAIASNISALLGEFSK